MTPIILALAALHCAPMAHRTAYDLVPAGPLHGKAGASVFDRQATRPSEQGYAVSPVVLTAPVSRALGVCQAPQFGVGTVVVVPRRERRT